ncbi:hypothetical protein [Castellaniella sp.]|uniref:hypothetical protein n=1 Tax=Castellaniella sp. TaxID=1955812 RepID=UPI002AFDF96B|nr:hypothetical protein [Castellaniella sp.]
MWQKWKAINHISWEQEVTSELASAFLDAERTWRINTEPVPADFPTGYFAGVVPGASPKFLARKIGDKYVVGPTAEELQARHGLCLRLALQYSRLDEAKRPPPEDFVYEALWGWDLTPAEQRWMIAKIITTR